jgi:hypothetical protein
MKTPGKAWLEFVLEQDGDGTIVKQCALFAPRGLAGHLYWWAVWPMHGLVFPSMARFVATGRR